MRAAAVEAPLPAPSPRSAAVPVSLRAYPYPYKAALAICSDSVWALLAARAREWFARKPARLDKLGATGGVMMVGLGAVMIARE